MDVSCTVSTPVYYNYITLPSTLISSTVSMVGVIEKLSFMCNIEHMTPDKTILTHEIDFYRQSPHCFFLLLQIRTKVMMDVSYMPLVL